MHTRWAVILLALGLADVAYLNWALGPEVLSSAAAERSEGLDTARAALRESTPLADSARVRSGPPAPPEAAPGVEPPPRGGAPQLAQAAADAPDEVGGADDAPDAREGADDVPGARGADDAKERDTLVVRFPETAAVTLTDDARAELLALAERLREEPGWRVRISGHADARGSRGSNRHLGARRARAVAEALLAAGVDRRRLETVSRGEDAPRASGQDESAWAENRRVEIELDAHRDGSERSEMP